MQEVAFEVEMRGGLPVYAIEPLRAFGIDAFVTERRGGVSTAPFDELNLALHVGDDAAAVAHNRGRVAKAIGLRPEQVVYVSQVHGATVVDADEDYPQLEGDAMVSRRDDVALAIMTADCLPIVIADAFSSTFAVVHAGWRGLVAGVIPAALAHFPDPATAHIFFGPCISRATYQVGAEVAAHFRDVPGAIGPSASPDDAPRFLLDLVAVAEFQARRAGVPAGQLLRISAATDGGQVFFSDRAARPCGRFAVVARRASYDYLVGDDA